MLRRRLALLLLAFLAPPSVAADPPLRVTNLDDGATLRYPLVLLRGRLDDTSETAVVCVNRSSDRASKEIRGVADKGRFLVLAELVPGDNKLLLRAGKEEKTDQLLSSPPRRPG